MDSILLQKQVRDNAKDLQEFCNELKQWGDEIKQKDDSLKRSPSNHNEIPLPRNKVSKISEQNKEHKDKSDKKKTKKIKGCDYAAWEKFDADAYCAKLENENLEENNSPEDSELSDEIDESAIDLANSEKEKGNAFVKKQQWDQAIDCYTRAIECYAYDPIYYANRALCYLKKEKYQNAETDCTTALQLDKTYVKAYQRRAAAREQLNQIGEAHSDLLKVLELEPKNKESKIVLTRIEKKLENVKQEKSEIVEQQRPISKFTLSRQKKQHSALQTQTQHDNGKKEIPAALGDHVIERVQPSEASNVNKIAQEINNSNKNKMNYSGDADKDLKNIHKMPSSIRLLGNESNGITFFDSVYKPPQVRSRKPLQRIQIIDVDLETERKYIANKMENNVKEKLKMENKNTLDEKQNVKSQDSILEIRKLEDIMKQSKEELNQKSNINTSDNLNLSIPKTAVQFYNSWKNLNNNKDRQKIYLQKINPNDFAIIFKESLESKVFSEILETLNNSCHDHEISVYDYLLGLSQVRRFGALIMFMSKNDKKNLVNIVDHLKQDNRYTTTDIDNLIKLYEL